MTNSASTRVAWQLNYLLNTTKHTQQKLHVETIPTAILARFHQDQPSPSKFGKIDQCVTSQFKFYVGGTYLVITHEVPHPLKRELG